MLPPRAPRVRLRSSARSSRPSRPYARPRTRCSSCSGTLRTTSSRSRRMLYRTRSDAREPCPACRMTTAGPPPVELPRVGQVAEPGIRATAARLDDHPDVVLGDLVHREMKLIADRGRPNDYDIAPRRPVWEQWLRRTGLPHAERAWVATQLHAQILAVVADATGRWLLTQHEDDGREAPFTSVVDGELRRIVVDRTFVEDGTRWIVDYKSTVLGGDDDEVERRVPASPTPTSALRPGARGARRSADSDGHLLHWHTAIGGGLGNACEPRRG